MWTSIEKIAYDAAQPDQATIIGRSRIVHGQYFERLDFTGQSRTINPKSVACARAKHSGTVAIMAISDRHVCFWPKPDVGSVARPTSSSVLV
jgi:hypothetical protein